MENVRELFKKIQPSDYYSNVNLHIHTNQSDGSLSPREVLHQAKNLNLKIISITDHNTLDAYKISKVSSCEELTVINGVEFDCWHKYVLMHIIGYDVDLDNPELNQICADDRAGRTLDLVRVFNNRQAKDVIRRIKLAGGIPVLAHPACYWALNMDKLVRELVDFGLEGIEVYYPYHRHRGIIKFYSVNKIKKVAEKYNLLMTGGTDCHSKDLRNY